MLKWLSLIVVFFKVINGFGQKPTVQLIVEPKVAQVGEEITVTVKTNIEGNINVDLPQAFNSSNNFMKGTSMETDYSTGQMVISSYSSQSGIVTKEGTFSFGPAYVRRGNKVYKSNVVTVKIERERQQGTSNEISNRQMRQPAFGLIEKSKNKIYEGEPVVLSARIYSQFEPQSIEGYESYALEGVIDKHEIGKSQNIAVDQKSIRGVLFYFFEYDKQVVFPSTKGKAMVKPFKLTLISGFEGYSLASMPTSIEVVPLPKGAPSSFNGAVGTFKIERSLEQRDFTQGDVFEMTVKIKGEGNIHELAAPKLDLGKGMKIYGDPIIKDAISYGINGAAGEVTYTYNVQLTENGKVTVPKLSFAYFNPATEEYVVLTENAVDMEVLPNKDYAIAHPTAPSTINSDQVINGNNNQDKVGDSSKVVFDKKYLWGIIGGPLCITLIFLLFRKKKETEGDNIIKEADRVIDVSEIAITFHNSLTELRDTCNNGKHNESYALVPRIFLQLGAPYLSEDMNYIPTKNELFDFFSSRGVHQDTIDSIKKVIEKIEMARYGMGIEQEFNDHLYEIVKINGEQVLSMLKNS